MSDLNNRSNDKQILLLQNKLEDHIEEFHEHVKEEHVRWDHLFKVQENNNTAIRELVESTKGVVEVWRAADGAVKVGAAFGKFVKWLMGLAFVGATLTWLIDKFG